MKPGTTITITIRMIKIIKVFTKPSCVQCTATKKALDKRDLDYETIDISVDEEARSLVFELGYTSVPVVVAGDQNWSGFRPDRIDLI